MATPGKMTPKEVVKAILPGILALVAAGLIDQLGLRLIGIILLALVGVALVMGYGLAGCARSLRVGVPVAYALVVVVIMVFVAIEAWSPQAEVNVRVVGQSGEHYSGTVDVILFKSQPRELGLSAATDDRGHARFRSLYIQDYYLLLFRVSGGRLLTTEVVAQATDNPNAGSLECPFPAHECTLEAFPVIFFEEGDASLSNASQRVVLKIAHAMLESDCRLLIQGHCSMTGSPWRNIELGGQRGLAVADAIIRAGIAPERLMIVSLGKSKPVAQGTSPEENRKNQRVECVPLPRNENFEKFIVRANAANPASPQVAASNQGGEGHSSGLRVPVLDGAERDPVALSLPMGANAPAAR
jgi:outer membrane protein OmpA-like peptidoglycan-associated protein